MKMRRNVQIIMDYAKKFKQEIVMVQFHIEHVYDYDYVRLVLVQGWLVSISCWWYV